MKFEIVQVRRTAISALAFALVLTGAACAQPPHCDPYRVASAAQCAKCHAAEFAVWQQTPHFKTFDTLHRNPKAQEIARRLGQSSIKRNDICIDCHYTSQAGDDLPHIVAGVSCESCHGAARDWIGVHSDYGGPTANRDSETEQHRLQRMTQSVALGMRNPNNLYSIARSCLQCHTVPNEALVNVGGHSPGSPNFELVAWSQGLVRHNFLRTGNKSNAPSPPDRLRVMFVVGLLADLEFSTRATALATKKSTYGTAVASRAAAAAIRLYDIQQLIHDPHLQRALEAFALARLKINNPDELNRIADDIAAAGMKLAEEADGSSWSALDSQLPLPTQYK